MQEFSAVPCSSTVAGSKWIECYLSSLSEKCQKAAVRGPGLRWFRFGGDERLNGLKINKDKCNFIIFNGEFPDCIFVNNQPVHSINLLKDLGLLVSSDLTWSNHISKKTSIEQ